MEAYTQMGDTCPQGDIHARVREGHMPRNEMCNYWMQEGLYWVLMQVCQRCLYINPVKQRESIGEQEREIQNPQVLSISSKSGDRKKVICRSVSSSEARA